MPNYIMTFTIENNDQRRKFDDFLKELGLDQKVDQSTRFGHNPLPKESVASQLEEEARELKIPASDPIHLYYGLNDSIHSDRIG